MARKNKCNSHKRANSEVPASNSPPLSKKPRTSEVISKHNEILSNKAPPVQPRVRIPRAPPPEPPSSVLSDHILVPPEADDMKIRDHYNIHTISASKNSSIQTKVRQVLDILRYEANRSEDITQEGIDKKKGAIVALTARAPASNKAISIAEIAKRELATKCWQYTACWTRLETVENQEKSKKPAKGKPDGGPVDSEDLFEVFEDLPERKMVRNVVCLAIYLSTEPVARLKELYSHQVTEGEKS
ncbi:hypothetical protein EJ08DRAFT_700596 [Tothia fuscella]|uniref:DNA/RNA-binding protein Alba-like domain-containing protein n=1 Tax=Tothia fuscella TaxID=1048955 RepID=A0A9P4NK98_9PEZI|nr:hypothetical protein EJ08DRAFT_700596 [Tothia fuscella]